MFDLKPLKVAFVGVEITKLVQSVAKEYSLEARAVATDGDAMKRALKDFSPDVVIADGKFISQVYSCVPQESRPSIFVVADENGNEFPTALDAGLADDVILMPFRRLELLSRLRWHSYLHSLRSVEGLNAGVTRLIHKLEEDLVFAQKIQRRLIKDRFPPMSGITIKSKYWCGMKGGGDYFDVFEFADKNYVGFLLTDVSSYKLSTAFITAMMQLPAKLGTDEIRDPQATVARIYSELKEKMDDKESFSIFYGVLDRRSFVLRYVAFGKVFLNLQSAAGGREWLYKGDRNALARDAEKTIQSAQAAEISFEPEDRLLILSDGLESSLETSVPKFLDGISERDPQSVMNEFSFALRSKHDPEGEEAANGDYPMLPEDCSVLLVDVAKNILRLAR